MFRMGLQGLSSTQAGGKLVLEDVLNVSFKMLLAMGTDMYLFARFILLSERVMIHCFFLLRDASYLS